MPHFWFTCDEELWVGRDMALLVAVKLLWHSGSACWKENVSNLALLSPVTKHSNKENIPAVGYYTADICPHSNNKVISRSLQWATYNLLDAKKSHLNKHLLFMLSLLFHKTHPSNSTKDFSHGTIFIWANHKSFLQELSQTTHTANAIWLRFPLFPSNTSIAGVHLRSSPWLFLP